MGKRKAKHSLKIGIGYIRFIFGFEFRERRGRGKIAYVQDAWGRESGIGDKK